MQKALVMIDNLVSSLEPNCFFSLEFEARKEISRLVSFLIGRMFNVELNAKKIELLISKQIMHSKHNIKGDLTLQLFKLSKELNVSLDILGKKLVKEINEYISNNKECPFQSAQLLNARINIVLTSKYLGKIIDLILDEKNSFIDPLPSNGISVMIEYSQPNTHKAFHVGHMRNVAIGDCLQRIFKHCGFESIPVNYFGDEGAHVAKCLWLLLKKIKEDNINIDNISKHIRGEWLGNIYSEAVNKLDLSTYTKYPLKGVIIAQVKDIKQHPNEPKWCILQIQSNEKNKKLLNVVCGINISNINLRINDLVCYVPVGQIFNGKMIEIKDMKGIKSFGMILDENEVNGMSNKKQTNKIFVINSKDILLIGQTLIEFGKYDKYKNIKNVEMLCNKYNNEQKEILHKLENNLDKELIKLYKKTRKWSLDEFKNIYEWLDAKFVHDFFESECSLESRELVDEYFKKGLFIKSSGAIGINLDIEKLGFCMLLKSDGSGLYATKDLVLARKKFDLFGIDQSIYVVDDAQTFHFKQVFATLLRMGYNQARKCYHLPYAQVILPSGKMSSRKGNTILFNELVLLLKKEIYEKFLNDKKKLYSAEKLSKIEQCVSVGAIRYGMLNHDNNKVIVFDLKQWMLTNGNTGPYLMYQYARIKSIIKKINIDYNSNYNWNLLKSNDEKLLLFILSQFQSKIHQICETKNPSLLCDYLYNICKKFSSWYANPKNSIKNCSDPILKTTRLLFAKAVANVIKTGIQLLGITPLEEM